MPKLKHVDLAGQEIKPGCIVAYAALWDRSATLKYGLVTRLSSRTESAFVEYGHAYAKRVVPTIRVVTVDRKMDVKRDQIVHRWELQKDGKEVALGWLDRMLVVPRSMVPEVVLQLFDAAQKGA
jgi:hypothetical protein